MRLSLRALLLLVVPAALAGQSPSDTVALNPVVVTATRIATRAADLPIAVTVISGVQLRNEGIRTVADALRSIPGAGVVTTSAYGSQSDASMLPVSTHASAHAAAARAAVGRTRKAVPESTCIRPELSEFSDAKLIRLVLRYTDEYDAN